MAVTLHDVARLAGVSVKTVSNYLHDYPYMRPETRVRVQEAIDELQYRPNLTARSLRSGRSGMIGLVLPRLRLSYYGELADTVIEVAERQGLVVLIEQTGAVRSREIEALSSARRNLTDGLIFSPFALGKDDGALFKTAGPMVLLGERIYDGVTDHVTMHNLEGARAATEHLISIGRRRIAVIGGWQDNEVNSLNLRLDGYRQALEAAGISYDPKLHIETKRDLHRRATGADAARALLASGVEFDAIFGLNDALALGAMRAIQESGRKVPADAAIIGFDDLDETRFSSPTLSTIDPGRMEIAEMAIQLLMERIVNPGQDHIAQLRKSPYQLVVRESTTLS